MTPQIEDVSPMAAGPNDTIQINGPWKTDTSKDIKKINIGKYICD